VAQTVAVAEPREAARSWADAPIWQTLTGAMLWVGVALRLWQYFSNPSFGTDEAALARNILDRSFAGLLRPLDYAQVAPPGFLLLTKALVVTLGNAEYVFRIIPVVAGVASLWLFRRLAARYLPPAAQFAAMVMFATAVPFVMFTSNFKPYSSDLAFTLLVVLMALEVLDCPLSLNRALGLGIAALAMVLFSQSVVFALTVGGAVIVCDARLTHRKDTVLRVAVVTAWAVSLLLGVGLGLRTMTPVDSAYMHLFWQAGFMPHAPAAAVQWMWTTVGGIFATPARTNAFDGALHYNWPVPFVLGALVGGAAAVVRDWRMGLLVVGPVLLDFAATFAGAFPLGNRVSLFLMPLLLLLTVIGFTTVGQLISRNHGAALALVGVPVALVSIVQQHPPRLPEHLRPILERIAAKEQPGDAVWIYYGAGPAFDYYRRRIPIHAESTVGDCDRVDPRHYLQQIDAERGRRRVWVVAAHGGGPFHYDERGLLTRYLDAIGERLDHFKPVDDNEASSAELSLYDLSSSTKLAAATAATFPVVGQVAPMAWTCYGVMTASAEKVAGAAAAVMAMPR
jgi:hypothetical protein